MIKALMRKRMRLTKNQKGMTLIELMAVVVILGILAAVAGVAVVNSFDKAKTTTDKASVTVIQDAATRLVMDKPTTYSISENETTIPLAALVTEGYLKETPKKADGTDYTTCKVKWTSATDKTLVWTIN